MDANFQATLKERLATLADFSETPDGITRPSFTESMRRANQTVADWMRSAGMSVHEDSISNLIGHYEGTASDAKTLILGSHLDTVHNAGKYDGILGVLLALACVEELNRTGQRLPFAIEVIAFCDEEGLRFHLPYLGSRAIAGQFTPDHLQQKDESGVTITQAVRDYGSNPDEVLHLQKNPDDLVGYLEVHIEQGPILEAEGLPVGIVSGIAGQSRLEIEFIGEAGHAGTVPMSMRRDALVAAAHLITAVQDTAKNTDGLVGTVGQLQVYPGASNAVPGRVVISLDVRHMDDSIRQTALTRLYELAQLSSSREQVQVKWHTIVESISVPCSDLIIEVFKQAVQSAGITPRLLSSGAGHDAVMMSQLTKSGMLFVRCRGGISHNPAEYADLADAEVAADILLNAVNLLAMGMENTST